MKNLAFKGVQKKNRTIKKIKKLRLHLEDYPRSIHHLLAIVEQWSICMHVVLLHASSLSLYCQLPHCANKYKRKRLLPLD